MPGTYRYSATFDRTYEEDSPLSADDRSRSKNRQPSYGRSLSDHGSRTDHQRSASTDSLDSMFGSSGSSTSHSRQASADNTEHIPTRRITKATAKPAHNPLQFVKVGASPLYRKPEQKKVAKEKLKEDEEEWQLNLDSWKNRRRKQSEGSLLRLEEIRRIELEEQERKHEQKKIKTKTFSEMMEERAHRPKQYNLVIYGRPSSEDEDTDNVSCTKSDSNDDSDKGNSDSTLCSNNVEESTVNGRQSTSDETLPENENDNEVSKVCCEQNAKRSHHNNVENNFTGINEYMILEKRMMKEKLLSGNGCANTDSGLDSLSSSHKAGDLADSASDFSQDSGSSLDSDFQHMTGSLTTGVELLEEFSSNSLPNYERKTDNGIELFLRIWLKQGSDSKDFGFILKEGKDQSTPVVHSVIPGGVGDLAGLRKGDQVLAINGECTHGHENEVMSFAVQQAIYSGHLDLLIWRLTDTDSETNGVGRERSNSIVLQRKSAFENGTQQKKSTTQRTSKDIRPAVDFKEKVSSFERRSSTEQEISNLVSKPVTSRKPPLVPNKPRLRSKSVPDASIYQRTNGVHKYASLPEDENDTLDDNVCDVNNSNDEVVNNSSCVNSSNQLTSNTTTEENCDNSHESEKSMCNVQNDLQPSEKKTDTINEELTRNNHDSNDKTNNLPSMNGESEEVSQPQWLINLNPVQESGLNIIYDSHPVQDKNVKKESSSSSSSESEQSTPLQQSKKKSNNAIKNQKCDDKTVDNSVKLADKAKCDKTAEKKQNPKKVKKEQSQEDILKFECDDLNSDIYEIPLNLIQDDILFADLDISSRQLEPPKEKPPPPPSNESDIESSENAPTVRANSTKEIKRELWKRRSNFLGIESEDHSADVDDSHIPPPPSMEDILKSERKLERENRQLLEQQTLIRLQKLAEEEEIARKEREIIENIEREERERQRQEEERQNILVKEKEMSTSEKKKEQEKLHNKHPKQNLEKSKSVVSKQEKQTPKVQDQQILQEREEYIKQQEKPGKLGCNAGSKQSNTSKNSSSLSQNNSSVVETNNSTPPNKVPTKKMILRQERERLRREQEALQKQWEEYEQQTKLQQQIWLQQKTPQSSTQQKSHSISSARQNKVPNPMPASHTQTKHELVERDNIINASRRPQATPALPEEELNSKDIVEKEHPSHNMAPSSQALTKRSLHSLGAAPKAKIVNNEQWIKPNEKVTKRRIESVAESRYNQYHWLVQEAEMRRITEQKERQHQRTSIHGRASAPTVPLHTQNNNSIYHNTQKQSLNHPTHCALPCGYSLEPQWNRNNSGTNVRHSRLSPDKNQCIGYTNSQRDASPIKPPRTMNSNNQEHLLSVSGRKRCSHCGEELGRGAAMIIESLQLFYHIQCFCCCVCQAQLGNGSCGTDVRVRNNKLHCQHCYSNDEAGLKFSQV